MSDVACQLHGIRKRFGPNEVLRGIDLTLPAATVTVLMGANGAGKSTLVKVLSGVHAADAGHMTLQGEPYTPDGPADAIDQGVVTVHQSIDDGVIPDLDVASNLALDRLTDRRTGLFVNRRRLREQAQRVAERMALDIDVDRPVRDLEVADRQLIAIARAMARQPRLLILDEPTSSLSSTEADRLFELIDRLRDSGVAILYISHRTADIRRIADRIVAMRDGQIAATFTERPLDYEAAVTAMLGHRMTEVSIEAQSPGDAVLSVHDLTIMPGADPVSFTVACNEVVVITGLLGSGKSRLAAQLFGLMPIQRGDVTLNGEPYAPQSPRDSIENGVFLCTRDRASNGVIPDFDLENNLTLPFFRRHSALHFLRRGSQRAATESMIDSLDIVCQSSRDDITTLSGGNQQKIMIGRWLSQDPRLLILDEPFQGVDIKARHDIGERIRASARERATLVFTAEIDEALEIADRILVLHEGSLVGEHINRDVDLKRLTADVSGARGASARGASARGAHTRVAHTRVS